MGRSQGAGSGCQKVGPFGEEFGGENALPTWRGSGGGVAFLLARGFSRCLVSFRNDRDIWGPLYMLLT